jgi:hypothetical protein
MKQGLHIIELAKNQFSSRDRPKDFVDIKFQESICYERSHIAKGMS